MSHDQTIQLTKFQKNASRGYRDIAICKSGRLRRKSDCYYVSLHYRGRDKNKYSNIRSQDIRIFDPFVHAYQTKTLLILYLYSVLAFDVSVTPMNSYEKNVREKYVSKVRRF